MFVRILETQLPSGTIFMLLLHTKNERNNEISFKSRSLKLMLQNNKHSLRAWEERKMIDIVRSFLAIGIANEDYVYTQE